MMRTAITREEACERAAGRIYLAQKVMEKIKYKEKTQRFMAVPEGAVERGGQIFYVTVREKPEEIRGVPLLCVQVSVRDRKRCLLPTGKGRNNQWPENHLKE